MLLIIGIALGAGATSAGISLYIDTVRQTKALRNSTVYREIAVTSREESEEMEVPAAATNGEELTLLTPTDLDARNEMQGVEYAFIANERRFDLRTGGFGPPPEDGPPPEPAGDGGEQQGRIPFDTEAPEINGPEPVLDEIYGCSVTYEFFQANDLYAERGSLFTPSEIEGEERVMVLGSALAEKLFEDGSAYGRQVYSRPFLYTITGILEPTGTDYDGMAFVPEIIPKELLANTDMARMYLRRNPATLHFVIDDPEKLDESKAQISTWFEEKYGEGGVTINLPREEAESVISRNRRIGIIVLFLALSGLIIADVNVSNILIGRMVRSRKTIGVLKALGASKRNIFYLFSLEGLLLSLGGAAGGSLSAFFLFRVMEQTLSISDFSPGRLALGIVSAWILTMLLTIIPAIQASKIPPADAIRNE